MGLDYSIYVGPFIRVTLGESSQEPHHVHDDLSRHFKGEPVMWYFVAHMTAVWLPNVRREGQQREFFFDPHDGEVYDEITPSNMDREVRWLAGAFAEEMLFLERAFGVRNVSIVWGVVSMIS